MGRIDTSRHCRCLYLCRGAFQCSQAYITTKRLIRSTFKRSIHKCHLFLSLCALEKLLPAHLAILGVPSGGARPARAEAHRRHIRHMQACSGDRAIEQHMC